VGTDDNVLLPSVLEGVASSVTVVRHPSPGVEAATGVAPGVASGRSGRVSSVVWPSCRRANGAFVDLLVGHSRPASSGHVVGEVDSNEDFMMKSAGPSPEEMWRAEVVACLKVRTSRRLETLEEGQRNAAVERMMGQDGLSSPAPEAVRVLVDGKSSQYINWGAR